MKKVIVFVLLGILVLAAGCSAANTAECTIELTGNATTGCAWEYTMSEEGIVTEASNDYVTDSTDTDMVGVGGKYIFTFAPAGEGDVTLHFVYRQPWEPDTVYAECDITLHSDGEKVTVVGEVPDPMADN